MDHGRDGLVFELLRLSIAEDIKNSDGLKTSPCAAYSEKAFGRGN